MDKFNKQYNFHDIPEFWGFSEFTPTIPKLYWNVKSQEQRILNLFDLLDKIINYCDQLGVNTNEVVQAISDIKDELTKLENGGLIDFYRDQINQWVADHMENIIKKAIQFVYFGLTDDGYFCAYIPDSWSEISFDTGAVFGRSDYGRLILRMQTDSSNSIDNGYSYELNDKDREKLDSIISDVENNTNRLDKVFSKLADQLK